MDNNNNHENHMYDGIVEENNRMPSWWVWLFICCVGFSFIYWIHYTFGGGENLTQEFNAAMKSLKQTQGQNVSATLSEEELLLLSKDQNNLVLGSKVYAEKCSVCHGADLQGVVGPNLTDKYWLHGKGKLQDIYVTIKNGVPEKGMPAWGPLLQDAELKGLVAYISSKKNSQPKNPKAPQGDVFDN